MFMIFDVKLRNAAWHVNEFNEINELSSTRCYFWTVCTWMWYIHSFKNNILFNPIRLFRSHATLHSWAWRHKIWMLGRLRNNFFLPGKTLIISNNMTWGKLAIKFPRSRGKICELQIFPRQRGNLIAVISL